MMRNVDVDVEVGSGGPAAILVVEDERVVALDIESSLKLMGYDVIGTVASGEDCLRQAGVRRPDLVLMDVRIAGQMDGIEAARKLRSSFDVPVVYLTAYSDEDMVARARETEPHGYILKPFRSGELRSAVEIALYKHRAETELRNRERFFATTLSAIADAVITVDAAGVVTLMNGAAEQLTEIEAACGRGRHVQEVLRLIDERTRTAVELPLERLLAGQQVFRLPANTLLAAGQGERPIAGSVSTIVGEDGSALGAVIVFCDLSEQRAMQQQLALTDRMASLGVLAAGVAHEINNPLTYVLSNTAGAAEQIDRVQLLVEKARRQPDRLEIARLLESAKSALHTLVGWIDDAQQGADRIQRIVSDLHAFGRPDLGAESGDVVGAIEWALRVAELQVIQRARLVRELCPVPHVRGGDVRLGQVFLNLILNAAQAIPEGNTAGNSIVVSTALDDRGWVVATVRDTGVGMTAEVLKRVFEPFFTTKGAGHGLGLGLSICNGIVQELGGELCVTSTPGKGSAFTLRLPPAAAERAPVTLVQTTTEALMGRVLIIDDESRLASAMARMLQPPHDVVVLGSAEDALTLLENDRGFDLILCDLMLTTLSGMDLYRIFTEIDAEVVRRMVFITGGAFSPRTVAFLESIPNPHLVKPFTARTLKDFVQSFLREHPRRRAS